MPIEHKLSTALHEPQAGTPIPDPLIKAGRLIVATASVDVAATDLNGSTYKLLMLPADCILHSLTRFDVTTLGLAEVRIGTFETPGALVSQAQAAENVITPIAAGNDERLWETLGLAENPGGHIGLYMHAIADATGAGVLKFQIHWIYN